MNATNRRPLPRPDISWTLIVLLCMIHGVGSWIAFGGRGSLASPWPMALHDHSIQEHNAWLSAPILERTFTTAGYDPYFMSGYAKSLLSSPSSTLFEVIALLTGDLDQAVVYKVTLFAILAGLPWLVALAGAMFRLGAGTTLGGVVLFLLYAWTDGGGGGYPFNYARVGMNAYLLSVPYGLVVTAGIVNYLKAGGRLRWLLMLMLTSLAFMEHVTSVLFLAPAAFAAYVVASWKDRVFPTSRHVGVIGLSIGVLLLNSFWWAPALALRSTRSPGGNFFVNDEPVFGRMAKIVVSEPPIQSIILGLALIGLIAIWKRDRIVAAGLGGFAFAGLGWGYLAGGFSALDFLQPGRQTYALYAAAALLGGEGLRVLITSIESSLMRRAIVLALLFIGGRIFGYNLDQSIRFRLGMIPGVAPRPFMASDPPPGLELITKWVRANMKPGERLFYEESGLGLPEDPDPFGGGRYSGLLPRLANIEVVGGFYLHVGLKTNFSQIGEGKFFEGSWTRDRFIRYAKMYRPSAIMCWSREARAFCLANPDLIKVSLDLKEGRLIAGRVVGFAGHAIQGSADVKAEAGVLRVSNIVPDLDGWVILRYHSVPGLRSRPSMRMDAVFLEKDPVPFIRLHPDPGQTETVLDLAVPPGR